MKYFTVILHEPELHTILAALQVYQDRVHDLPLDEDELLALREKINFSDETTAEEFRAEERIENAREAEKHAIALAHVLAEGKDLLRREIQLRDEKIEQYGNELDRIDEFLQSFGKNTGSYPGCQHEDHEDHMICQGCGECREDLDEDDYCPECNTL